MRRLLIYVLALYVLGTAFVVSATSDVDEASNGYIVTLVKNSSDITLGGSLFSESPATEHLEGELLTEFVTENIENTKELIPEIGMIKVEDEETLNTLVELGLVEFYEPNHTMYLHGYDYEANPTFSSQWGHPYINSRFAWDAGIFGNEVRVGVIDSGVYPHEDLMGNLVEGYNFLSDNTDTTDNLGHGTAVAGIIAAQCNNLATVGLAHRATIVPLKVANENNLDMADAIDAMKAAVDKYNCDVINMSLGTTVNSTSLRNAVNHVLNKGVILVASAGNNGTSAYSYPASYDGVVSVANVQKASDGSLFIRSSSQHNDKVNIAAPGTKVYSLINARTGVKTFTGTSFSSPYVAAAAALVKSIRKDVDCATFQYALKKTADKSYLTESQGAYYWGAGLIDVKELVKYFLPKPSVGNGLYISDTDLQDNSKVLSIYITNLNEETTDFGTVFVYNRLAGIKVVPAIVEGNGSLEIPVSSNGTSGQVNVIMLDEKLRPIINKKVYSFEN